jgi:hypothetical protein
MPPWFQWFTFVNPVAWTLNGLISSQYGNVTIKIQTLTHGNIEVREFILAQYGYKNDEREYILLILVAFCVCFASVAIVALSLLKYHRL